MSPKIGVGVLIIRDGKLLLGRRKGSHGAATWSAPGGHLEYGETPEACARRETEEETGLTLPTVEAGRFVSDVFPEVGKHYVTLFMMSRDAEGVPRCCEPEKCEGWSWFSPDALPSPLFAPLETLIREYGLSALR
ncbi:nucleotide triphosphate diphosphatase NUDT15 [Atlantibacter hermannii]|uniref:nucleotide triphosphate diphosphatase NUDT15 n=1 Tax=Atlantibacter hermannii TaxID=565 RepID=UPI00254B3FB4|nr:NUDIX hydrolase [Atlantibacter hermannii]